MPAVPLIIPGIQAGMSAYSAYKNAKAQKQQAGLQGQALAQQTAGLGSAQRTSQDVLRTALPMTQQAGNYFGTLLRGSRGAMNQATAGPAAQITSTYRGAARGLTSGMIRGGARDTAMAELNRDRAGALAGLHTGVQPAAAAQLAQMGQQSTGQGLTGLISGSTGMASAGQQYGNNAQMYGANQREDMAGVGRGVSEILRGILNRRKGGQVPMGGGAVPGVGGMFGGSAGTPMSGGGFFGGF